MSEKLIPAAIFDLDGTLIYTLACLAKSGNAMLESYGLDPYPVEDFKMLVGNGSRILVERMLAGRQSDLDVDQALDRYLACFRENVLYQLEAYAGLPESLQALKDQGYLLAVLTNKPDDLAKTTIEACYPPGFFSVIRGQRAGVPIKPDPRLLPAFLSEIGADPARSVFVGDSAVDMETAQTAGLKAIGVLWGYRGREELQAAGADFLLEDPSQLLAAVGEPL